MNNGFKDNKLLVSNKSVTHNVCLGCTPETGRSGVPNCHSTCERYLKEKASLDERNKIIRKNKDMYTEQIHTAVSGINRVKKTRKGR